MDLMDVNEGTVMNLPSDPMAEQMQSEMESPDHARPIADIVVALSTIEGFAGPDRGGVYLARDPWNAEVW